MSHQLIASQGVKWCRSHEASSLHQITPVTIPTAYPIGGVPGRAEGWSGGLPSMILKPNKVTTLLG